MRTVIGWYQGGAGGPLMVPLLLLGLAGLVLIGERAYHIVLRARTRARPFMERVISLVRSGKTDEALRLCAEHQSPIPDLGLVILRSRIRDESELLNIAEASSLTLVPRLTRRLDWMPRLATLGVILGLLGGVVNLHDALMQASTTLVEDRTALLTGIAFAMRPLGVGLLTAAILLAGHMYLEHEARATIDSLEEFATRLVNALIDRPDVRLGHR